MRTWEDFIRVIIDDVTTFVAGYINPMNDRLEELEKRLAELEQKSTPSNGQEGGSS
jgi:polyhydroxyalkanoate synthesis regulator phasin